MGRREIQSIVLNSTIEPVTNFTAATNAKNMLIPVVLTKLTTSLTMRKSLESKVTGQETSVAIPDGLATCNSSLEH